MKTVIHIKTDKEVKENAQKAAKDLGLSLSDVINASLRNFIRTREVIFSDIPQMTPELEKRLEEVEEDIKQGRNLSPSFKNVDEAIAYLKKQKK
ncbi:type II toxin-antitoxin system RelB/DinJ family antitoxin [Candidatus Daviesbacteria bacterium]|nr:type II toxin-antitoxin system RelB/DinJ family antitoxin [Candidatus Daviesbacteria bacterium]